MTGKLFIIDVEHDDWCNIWKTHHSEDCNFTAKTHEVKDINNENMQEVTR